MRLRLQMACAGITCGTTCGTNWRMVPASDKWSASVSCAWVGMGGSASSRRQLDEFIIDEMRRKQNERLLQILEEEQEAEQVALSGVCAALFHPCRPRHVSPSLPFPPVACSCSLSFSRFAVVGALRGRSVAQRVRAARDSSCVYVNGG